MASFGRPLNWPEDEKVAPRYILDHAQDLTEKPRSAQDVAMKLIAIGLRRQLPSHSKPPHREMAGVPSDAQSAPAVFGGPYAAGA
jgi:hypothetical protein